MQLKPYLHRLFLIVIFIFTIVACGTNGAKGENDAKEPTAEPIQSGDHNSQTNNSMTIAREEVNKNKMTTKKMTIKGQIVFQKMEGGFYSFIAEDGAKYTPMQLPQTHQRNGLIVEIVAEEMLDVMTTTQFGKVIKIHDIKVLDESKVNEITR